MRANQRPAWFKFANNGADRSGFQVREPDLLRVRMASDVGQCFLDDVKDLRLLLGAQAQVGHVALQMQRDAGALAELGGLLTQPTIVGFPPARE